jgi:hypothetical protein
LAHHDITAGITYAAGIATGLEKRAQRRRLIHASSRFLMGRTWCFKKHESLHLAPELTSCTLWGQRDAGVAQFWLSGQRHFSAVGHADGWICRLRPHFAAASPAPKNSPRLADFPTCHPGALDSTAFHTHAHACNSHIERLICLCFRPMLAVDPRKSKVFGARSVAYILCVPGIFPLGGIDLKMLTIHKDETKSAGACSWWDFWTWDACAKDTRREPHIVLFDNKINEQLSRVCSNLWLHCAVGRRAAAAARRKWRSYISCVELWLWWTILRVSGAFWWNERTEQEINFMDAPSSKHTCLAAYTITFN